MKHGEQAGKSNVEKNNITGTAKASRALRFSSVAVSKRSDFVPWFSTAVGLENNFRSKLQAASSNAVGDDISGEGITPIGIEREAAKLRDAVHTGGGSACIYVRYSQPLAVKEVERLGLKLDRETLGNQRVLKHGHVDRVYRLPAFGVPPQRRERRAEEFLSR